MLPRPVRILEALFVACVSSALAQTLPFDLDAYKSFLATHQDMTTEQLLAHQSAGTFARGAPTDLSSVLYADSITLKYGLTDYERSLIEKHGFMVTERVSSDSVAFSTFAHSFGFAFADVWRKDLPVFVSTDAILHAWHMSYDKVLMDVETGFLIRRLDTLLTSLHGQMPGLATAYAGDPRMLQMVHDLDVYLTVPRKLLSSTIEPVFAENVTWVAQLLGYIEAQQPLKIPLFQSTRRYIDFSQFTPRGHYTKSPGLSRYFQAMIWLGRTELVILPALSGDEKPPESDFQRQAIDAVLLHEAALGCDGYAQLEDIDRILRFFVGESDNITLPQIQGMVQETGLDNAAALLDTLTFRDFCAVLEEQSFAYQRINSQILFSDPMSPEGIRPAGAFLLLGQRFVIDSYVTGNVVFDQILYQGSKIKRMLPSTLDVLYALGNNAAAQLLVHELDRYHYGANLAALRYLVDSYEPGFWAGTLYNGWLRAIRTLNPPHDRDVLPRFMRTAAWWQEKINTQLAAWSQLRHDNLLYAKQSYSGTLCSFPATYVEPIAEFYEGMREMADSAAALFESPMLNGLPDAPSITGFFRSMASTMDTLAGVARKELLSHPPSDEEKGFLCRLLYETGHSGKIFDGWYADLYYTGEGGLVEYDRIVADVHTAPTDEAGNPAGWVLHAGTGAVNLAVVATELADGRAMAFVGPVQSYYEHVTTNFKRLTDNEWRTLYAQSPTFRPSFVNLYLADAQGETRGSGLSLVTGIEGGPGTVVQPSAIMLSQNYPNPFNGQTVISFAIPPGLSGSLVELTVYDLQGRRVRTLMHQVMPGGTYVTRWNGDRDNGAEAASGVYFYHLRVGSHLRAGKMALVR